MVLVHGFTGGAAAWGEELLHVLAAEGRPVVAVTLPGHSGEPGPCTLAAAMDRIVGAVAGPFDLVGYSMGGRLALHVAVAHPERVHRLVLESASPGLPSEDERRARREADETLAERIEREGVEQFAEAWAALPVLRPARGRPTEAQARQAEVRRTHTAEGLADALRGFGTGALPSLWDRLGEVRADTLLLVGEHDPKFVAVARDMGPSLASARIEVVAGAGHTVHLDRPADWVRAVLRHLG